MALSVIGKTSRRAFGAELKIVVTVAVLVAQAVVVYAVEVIVPVVTEVAVLVW